MGCCASDYRKFDQIKITESEKVIERGEQTLLFRRYKLKNILISIENIDFPLDVDHLNILCYSLKTPNHGYSYKFFHRLASQGMLNIEILKILAILLCRHDSISRGSLIFSPNKEEYLQNIKLLFETATYLIPLNLELYDLSIAKYAEKLKFMFQENFKELKALSIKQIREKIDFMIFSSKDIRITLFHQYKALKSVRKTKKYKKVQKKTYKGQINPLTNIETLTNAHTFALKSFLSSEMNENSIFDSFDEREFDSGEKVGIFEYARAQSGFNEHLANFSKKISEACRNMSTTTTQSRTSRSIKKEDSLNQSFDFLEKLKGIKSSDNRKKFKRSISSIPAFDKLIMHKSREQSLGN